MSDIIFSNFLDGGNSSNTLTFVNTLDGGQSNTTSFVGLITGNKSTNRLKEKISDLVKNHFPEFIQTDYTTFVAFVEAYYKFLETDLSAHEVIQNARAYNDIDKTIPSFVYYFLQNYASLLPVDALANQKLVIKRIKDLYQAKGSALSFKLLFRILFNQEITIEYPYENVLRASDGNFFKKTSVVVTPIVGSIDLIKNRFLTYTLNGALYQTPILNTISLTDTYKEISLDVNKISPDYVVGEYVYVYNSKKEVIFSGVITAFPTSLSIRRGGTGFKVGQVFSIDYNNGINTFVKVGKVGPTGNILSLKIINFGYGYDNSFLISLDSSLFKSISSYDSIVDSTGGFSDNIEIYLVADGTPSSYFASDYTEFDYIFTSRLANQDSDLRDPIFDELIPENIAIVRVFTGGLAKHLGSYITNRSILSDSEIRIQDDLLYQPFSYQLTTDLEYSKFFSIIKELVHPAGQRLFNKRVLSDFIDVSNNVISSNVYPGNINFEAFETIDPSSFAFFTLERTISGFDEALALDTLILSTSRNFVDSAETSQFSTLLFTKNITDSVNTEDYTDVVTPQRGVEDNLSAESVYLYTINKEAIVSEISSPDFGVVLQQDYVLSSYFGDNYSGISNYF